MNANVDVAELRGDLREMTTLSRVNPGKPAPIVVKASESDVRELRPYSLKGPYTLKRAWDAGLAALLLAVTAPVLAVIWLLIVATSPGPGLYWSRRVGQHGKIFRMPKFRTMEAHAPEAPREALSLAQCPITPVGALLRRTSLDELPQLWSILKGDMSFIGPRPLMPDDPGVHARRHFPVALSVRPGLSGLAQVSGRNHVTPRRKARLDALYARRASPGLDAQILFRTALIVVTGQGFL